MAKAKKVLRITTPKGKAVYPWLTVPDTKFKADGEYKIDLILTPEEADDIIKQLDAMVDEQYAKTTKGMKPAQIERVFKHYPYKDEVVTDEEGEETETGNLQFAFRSNAFFMNKKTNEKVDLKPKLADGQGNWIKTKVRVGTGSLVKVNFTPKTWEMDGKMLIEKKQQKIKTVGVKMYINAVQIIELVEFGGASAEEMGFGAEEGGFDAASAQDDVPWANEEVPIDDGDDGGDF
jgi:hypothetical protein